MVLEAGEFFEGSNFIATMLTAGQESSQELQSLKKNRHRTERTGKNGKFVKQSCENLLRFSRNVHWRYVDHMALMHCFVK